MSKKHGTITVNSVDTMKETGWDSGIKTAKFCGRCDKTDVIIRIMPDVHEKIQALNEALDSLNIEWLGYLLGISKDNIHVVDDIEIPEQIVTGANAVVAEKYSNERLIGTVHLHPFANGTFFSNTDEEKIGQNHDVMIVTTPSGEYKGSALVNLDCGGVMRADAKVEALEVPNPELDEFIKLAGGKIKIKKYEVVKTDEDKSRDNFGYGDYGGYYGTAKYCGSCHKKLDTNEMTIHVTGIEVCMPCYRKSGSLNLTP